MLKNKTFTFLFIIFFIMCYYGWIFVFFQDNSMREFGLTFFPFIGTFISIIWLTKTLPVLVTEHKRFVLILILGLLLFLFSNIISLSTQVLDYHYRYVNISSYIWLISYLVVFISLIYKLKLLYKSNSMGPFFFNIVIFMIAATTVSIHYFINPTIKLSIEQQSSVFINTLYPIINLGTIFVTINIFVMTRHKKEKLTFFFLTFGFLIHSVADAIYVFQLMNNQYLGGILVNPLWTIAILLIGYSSFFVEEQKEEKVWTFHSRTVPVDNGLMLNLSVILLAALVMEEVDWNWTILSVGLILSIVIIVLRQIFIIKKNRKLLENLSYHAYYDKLTGILNRASFRKDTADIIRFSKEIKDLLLC